MNKLATDHWIIVYPDFKVDVTTELSARMVCALVSLAMLTVWCCLTTESALSGYRYSAGNAMGIVAVVDWEQVGCCALPDRQPQRCQIYSNSIVGLFVMIQGTSFLSRLQVRRRLAT
jgi:hypothetical protein